MIKENKTEDFINQNIFKDGIVLDKDTPENIYKDVEKKSK